MKSQFPTAYGKGPLYSSIVKLFDKDVAKVSYSLLSSKIRTMRNSIGYGDRKPNPPHLFGGFLRF